VTGGEIELDDISAIELADPGGMLPAVASAAAQVRAAATATAETDLSSIVGEGRPRAIVCVGMGGSGIAGDVLGAITGVRCPVPVVVHKDFGLPGWVGVNDLVIATSCGGSTAETLSAVDEAIRRGAQWLAVGAARSPLATRAEQSGAPLVSVPGGRQPRASLWALAVPALLLAADLGLIAEPLELDAVAGRLEQVAAACHVGRDTLVNPAKNLAISMAGNVVSVWGSTALTGVAAYRFACQLNENAKVPAAQGVLPEVGHNQIVAFDGPFAGSADIFAAPELDGPAGPVLAQVLLRDLAGERPEIADRVAAIESVAASRGVRLRSLVAEGRSPLERLASIIGVVDFATVYASLYAGLDPTPVVAIDELKRYGR
jgi:glucose/mannose-6-phosphate isomerase